MYSTVYEINRNKLEENSHKSARIESAVYERNLDKWKEISHKSACIIQCMRET
jgi:hypothetical protein